MKFAKTLEDLMVPEWRTQYVDYKVGKKRIKATTNKLRNASPSPALTSLRRTATRVSGIGGRGRGGELKWSVSTAVGSSSTRRVRGLSILLKPTTSSNLERTPRTSTCEAESATLEAFQERSPLQPIPIQSPQTASPSIATPSRRPSINYGSSGFSPSFSLPRTPDENHPQPSKPPSLQLPDPIQPFESSGAYYGDGISPAPPVMGLKSVPIASPTVEAGRPVLTRSDTRETGIGPNPPLLKRLFTLGKTPVVQPSSEEPSYEEAQSTAEKEFLKWLLGQLKKCEKFYAYHEMEFSKRFDEMREQLDTMRERWFKAKHNIPFEEDDVEDVGGDEANGQESYDSASSDTVVIPKKRAGWKSFAEAMNGLTRPYPTIAQANTAVMHHGPEGTRDYVRQLPTPTRKPLNNPTHRVAKRKLKKAYIEYYHGLEMLKSYVTVNRECFRKITKKFDKASGLRTSHRFMTAYVDKSKFGGADNDLDDMLNDTEVLFARFFERGNRKEASARLRSRESKTVYYRSVWMTGFYLGCSLVVGIYGLFNASILLYDDNQPERATQMSYLLQIWAGVALLLGQVFLCAINLRVWTLNRINYAFIFEFDSRHQLNYRQFLELPALLNFIFSVCFWFSCNDFWKGRMDMIYWPAIYISLASVLLLNPLHMCYYHTRMWILGVFWRLCFSGLYPVEFKDFWLGDLLCSQTYALGNISLFFCLYINGWQQPAQCNSDHSRLVGFLSALPSTWRLLQCVRRYKNSKMWFPHLVNATKYFCTINYYMTLSLWRIDKSNQSFKAAFIAAASINSIYTTIWDIGMDWSLLDPYAKRPFLRKNLGYKQAWPYYLALFVDPILRCTWFFYIVYANQLQHSALMSFMLAIAEVLRRFMWCFFRMENEHVGNVGANRAYRNLPLPYRFPKESPSPPTEDESLEPINATNVSVELDLERTDTLRHRFSRSVAPPSPMVRAMNRVGRTLNQAHLQDYERRRTDDNEEGEVSGESDDEEDGEDYYERTREAEGSTRRRSAISGGRM